MKSQALPVSLRSAYGDWIAGQPWDLFVTMTSEKQTHPEALLKRHRYCMNKISDHVYGNNWERRGLGVQWLVGMERHKSGWPHSHAVVRFPLVDIRGQEGKAIFDLGYWRNWMTETGGFVRLDQPRSQQAVVQYVSKYVVKDGELHWSDNCEFPHASGFQTTILQSTS